MPSGTKRWAASGRGVSSGIAVLWDGTGGDASPWRCGARSIQREPPLRVTAIRNGFSALAPPRGGTASTRRGARSSARPSRARGRGTAATARRKAGIGDPMRAVGRHRQIAALHFVRPLRAGLDPLQAALDRELDRAVIAALEMEERVFAVAAPIAAIDRVAAEDVEGAGDVFAGRAAP